MGQPATTSPSSEVDLFLCGDVMIGRGIDQILPDKVEPRIYEDYIKNSADYVLLAERANGLIDQPVSYSYIWGDAMAVWKEMAPAIKIINLETSITLHEEPWPGKGINYRMHPKNVKVLNAAGIDFTSLANNHTLDWGRKGLLETMQALNKAEIVYAGAGRDLLEAEAPAVFDKGSGRVIILAFGSITGGIPPSWAAASMRAGINLLPDLSAGTVKMIHHQIKRIKQPNDVVIFSVHWGGNWGYNVPAQQQVFAHQLIDVAEVDLVHGHSSHHPKGMEVYKNKLIIYGAGDFINDYEGISGHERYRADLSLMYFPILDFATGDLVLMKMIPMQIKNFRLNNVSNADARWLHKILNRESNRFGAGVKMHEDQTYSLTW